MTKEEFLTIALRSYRDLDNPSFDFVSQSFKSNPYKNLMSELSQVGEIEEDTDLNEDVSFGVAIKTDEGMWILRLSMLERLALLLRVEDTKLNSLVSPRAPVKESELRIINLLSNHNILLLQKEELEQECPVHLLNVDSSRCRVFQAFFCDTDVLPWAR